MNHRRPPRYGIARWATLDANCTHRHFAGQFGLEQSGHGRSGRRPSMCRGLAARLGRCHRLTERKPLCPRRPRHRCHAGSQPGQHGALTPLTVCLRCRGWLRTRAKKTPLSYWDNGDFFGCGGRICSRPYYSSCRVKCQSARELDADRWSYAEAPRAKGKRSGARGGGDIASCRANRRHSALGKNGDACDRTLMGDDRPGQRLHRARQALIDRAAGPLSAAPKAAAGLEAMPRSMSESPAIVPIAVVLIEFPADRRNSDQPLVLAVGALFTVGEDEKPPVVSNRRLAQPYAIAAGLPPLDRQGCSGPPRALRSRSILPLGRGPGARRWRKEALTAQRR